MIQPKWIDQKPHHKWNDNQYNHKWNDNQRHHKWNDQKDGLGLKRHISGYNIPQRDHNIGSTMTKFSPVTIVVIPAVNFVMKETMLHGTVDMEVQFSVINALSGATKPNTTHLHPHLHPSFSNQAKKLVPIH